MIVVWVLAGIFILYALTAMFAKISTKIFMIIMLLIATIGMALTFNWLYIPNVLPLQSELLYNTTLNQTSNVTSVIKHVYPELVDFEYTAYARAELDNLIWLPNLFWDKVIYHSINARAWTTPFGESTTYTLFGTGMSALLALFGYLMWKIGKVAKYGFVSPIMAILIFIVMTGFASGIRLWIDQFDTLIRFAFYLGFVLAIVGLIALEYYRRENKDQTMGG